MGHFATILAPKLIYPSSTISSQECPVAFKLMTSQVVQREQPLTGLYGYLGVKGLKVVDGLNYTPTFIVNQIAFNLVAFVQLQT